MKTLVFLIISIVGNLWLASAVIRLEKFHYSTMIGACSEQKIAGQVIIREYDSAKMYKCLEEYEPRTSDLWNLLYGLRVL
jgi:hypothetical protein